MIDRSVNVLRYGSEEALPAEVPLRAGPLSLLYSHGDLRVLRLGGDEVLNRLYVAVRDRNWNTIPMTLFDEQIDDRGDSFAIRYRAEHRQGETHFVWQGRIEGGADGTIRFHMDGEARSTFLRNRIGFCILHPATAAGAACRVLHVDGSREESRFPQRISPHQPFFDLRAITHEVRPGVMAEVRMEGDTFEMEDQRNWTDASFKTYSTPLALPFPVEIAEGTRVQQTVTLILHGEVPANIEGVADQITLTVGSGEVGTMPRLGLGLSSVEEALDRKAIGRLRALHPAHLRVDLDLAGADCEDRLRRAVDEADVLGCRLEVALHLSDNAEEELRSLRTMLNTLRPPLSHWLIFHKQESGTQAVWVDLARRWLGDYDHACGFGGGANAYFTELNRERPAATAMDLICYSINPQVHAFDNRSLMETLPIQGTTVESARLLSAGRPIAVTPITLRPRFNPNATGAEHSEPGQLPSQVDPRQMSLFAAAWTVGSLKAMAESGADQVTYYETLGWRGVLESESGSPLPAHFPSIPGGVFPLYHVLADVAGAAGRPVLSATSSDSSRVTGLAFAVNGGVRILLANLTNAIQEVHVAHGGDSVHLRLLNEQNAIAAMHEPEQYRSEERPAIRPAHGRSDLRLLPYAVARLDVEGDLRG